MTRVAHCIADIESQSGGTARVVRDLTDALSVGDDPFKVMLLSQQRPGAKVLTMAPGSSVDQRLAPSGSSFALKSGRPLKRLLDMVIERSKPELLHDHGIWMPSNHCVAVAARRFGIPLVLHPHGMLEPWALQHRGWKKRLALRLYQRGDLEIAALLFATAEQEAENIRQLGFRQPIAIIPNGVKFTDPPLDGMLRKDEPQGPRTVLFLSRIHPKKGLLNLLEAWSRVQPVGWRLRLAGPDDGGHLAEVMQRVQALGLEVDVEYMGEVAGDAKAALFENADLFVLPSFSENFGVVVAEALTYGVPVITTQGTPWKGLRLHECGWWIDSTADALTETLRQALSMSPAALRAMGNKGRIYVLEFDWSGIVQQTADVYRWVLGQGPLPGCVVRD